MAEYSMPFDMPIGAEDGELYKYTADEVIAFDKGFFTNGIFLNEGVGNDLSVTAGDGLSVVVSPGMAIIEGRRYRNTASKNISLSSSCK